MTRRNMSSSWIPASPQHIVVMGVSGCGKTSVGSALAQRLGCEFLDGDTLHSAENIAKMTAGTPLTDEDRFPWLRAVGRELGDCHASGHSLVVGCSALRRSYRDLVREQAPGTVFFHLHGDIEVLTERLRLRSGHFMPATLLASQLDVLEPLEGDEQGTVLDVGLSITEIVDAAVEWLSHTR